MRIIFFLAGVIIAGIGGTILYRTLFLDPASAYVITESHVRELPNTTRIVMGSLLFIGGALIGFFSLRRER